MISSRRAGTAPRRTEHTVRVNRVATDCYKVEVAWESLNEGVQGEASVEIRGINVDASRLADSFSRVPSVILRFVNTVRSVFYYTDECKVAFYAWWERGGRAFSLTVRGDDFELKSKWSSYNEMLEVEVKLGGWMTSRWPMKLGGQAGSYISFVESLARGFCLGTEETRFHRIEVDGKKLEVVSHTYYEKKVTFWLSAKTGWPGADDLAESVEWFAGVLSQAMRDILVLSERALKHTIKAAGTSLNGSLTFIKPDVLAKQKSPNLSKPLAVTMELVYATADQLGIFDEDATSEELLAKLALTESLLVIVSHSRRWPIGELLSTLSVVGDVIAALACLRGANPLEVAKVVQDPLSYLCSLVNATVTFSSGKVYVMGKELRVRAGSELCTALRALESLFSPSSREL